MAGVMSWSFDIKRKKEVICTAFTECSPFLFVFLKEEALHLYKYKYTVYCTYKREKKTRRNECQMFKLFQTLRLVPFGYL